MPLLRIGVVATVLDVCFRDHRVPAFRKRLTDALSPRCWIPAAAPSRSASLPEGGFVETSELAAVQLGPLGAQDSQGFHADPKVLADRPLIEGIGLAGQLYFAM